MTTTHRRDLATERLGTVVYGEGRVTLCPACDRRGVPRVLPDGRALVLHAWTTDGVARTDIDECALDALTSAAGVSIDQLRACAAEATRIAREPTATVAQVAWAGQYTKYAKWMSTLRHSM